MLIHIPDVLTKDELAHCQTRLSSARWGDGRVTAGHQSAQVKYNAQLPEESEEARELGAIVMRALERNALFVTAALPQQVFPPLFNRYETGMSFGTHVDNAVRVMPRTGRSIRTDLSATLFLNAPGDYDGGELVIEDIYGAKSVKLPAGHMILYPATSLHHVTPITRGARIASFFWIQSMVRDAGDRRVLFDLDRVIVELGQKNPDEPALVKLTSIYHNLIRKWGEI
jgi:PKHD-type hydroxylase